MLVLFEFHEPGIFRANRSNGEGWPTINWFMPSPPIPSTSNFIAGLPKATLLFGVFLVILYIVCCFFMNVNANNPNIK